MLDTIAVDIVFAIADFLPAAGDCCNLRAACRHLRDALAPLVFRSVRATNLDQDRAAIAALVAAQGHHFQHVRFQCMLHGERYDDDCSDASSEGGDDIVNSEGPTFVPTDILLGLLATNMHALTLEFIADDNFEPKDYYWVVVENRFMGSAYISYETESAKDVAAAERRWEWRRVMADTWRAVALNTRIRSLTIRSLPPIITTTWHRPEWASFVDQIEHLSIGMWGACYNPTQRYSIETDGYQDFLTVGLQNSFFNHAEGLVSFVFVSSPCGTYGGDNQVSGTPFTLLPSDMPRLRRLRLQNCFFDAALLDFLQAHTPTLESIHLIDFMAASNALNWARGTTDENLTWAGFFDGIASAKPLLLTDFRLTMRKVSMNEVATTFQDSSDGLQILHAMEQKLAEDEAFPLFYYGYLSNQNGCIIRQAADKIVRSFRNGEDLASYERLMAIVRANKEGSISCRNK
ncbi:hypothetical protein DFJ73DRAFT_851449 [Zopfochytrium polystomum]|nr:hypothetical protein DFJ73DRAFT_851449 [Zopfochytrium polystomum]